MMMEIDVVEPFYRRVFFDGSALSVLMRLTFYSPSRKLFAMNINLTQVVTRIIIIP